MMIAADVGRAALVATVPVAYAFDALGFAQLYAVAFLSGTLAVIFDLSYPTVFVSLTSRERFVEGNSLVNGSRSFAYVAGPSLGGLLVQDRMSMSCNEDGWRVVTERQPTAKELDDLRFAWRVCAAVKSNAIVLARGGATLGIGAGQMSRVDSSRIAVMKAADQKADLQGAALASCGALTQRGARWIRRGASATR